MKLSIIIPVYNSASSISKLIDAIEVELRSLSYEVILINDGSRDESEKVCEKLATHKSFVNLISLRKNFGEHNAVLCGLSFAKGDYSVIIDDDFQNPPSEIIKLLETIEKEGKDVVYSKYSNKKHHFFRNIGSRINDRMANLLLNKPKELYLSSFKIIKKELVEELIKYQGPFPYIDGLIFRATNHIGTQVVTHQERATGKSNYTFSKLLSLYLNMFFNFSVLPLRFFTLAGVFVFLAGMILMGIVVYEKVYLHTTPPGWTFTVVIILSLSGFQIVFLGMIAEYLGKMFMSVNGKPQYVIRKKIIK